MDLPPSRYRVIERGRRLEVIDTRAAGRESVGSRAMADAATALNASRPQSAGIANRPDTVRSVPVTRPGLNRDMASNSPPDLLVKAAGLFGSGRDDDGRLLLSTARWYDAKGPRVIALGEAAERQFGAAMLVLLAIVAGAIIVGVVFGWFAFVILFVAISQGRRVKAVITPWLDRLADG